MIEFMCGIAKQRAKAAAAITSRQGKATDEEMHRLEVKKEAYAMAVAYIVGVAK